MDLQQYKKMIQSQLMGAIHNQVHAENENAQHGLYTRRNANQYKKVASKIIDGGAVRGKIPQVVGYDSPSSETSDSESDTDFDSDSSSDSDSDSDSDTEEGGKMHFIKHMKKMHLGKHIKNAVGHGVKALGKEALKEGSKLAVQGAKDFMTVAPEIAETGAEYAPLLLAAGMKSGRKQTDKQQRRTVLVRKLMKKHNLSMCQASSYIKQHNIDY